jgi:hypothetical protein
MKLIEIKTILILFMILNASVVKLYTLNRSRHSRTAAIHRKYKQEENLEACRRNVNDLLNSNLKWSSDAFELKIIIDEMSKNEYIENINKNFIVKENPDYKVCSKEIVDVILDGYISKMGWLNSNLSNIKLNLNKSDDNIQNESYTSSENSNNSNTNSKLDIFMHFIKNHPKAIGIVFVILKFLSSYLKEGNPLKLAIEYILKSEQVIAGCIPAMKKIWGLLESAWISLSAQETVEEKAKIQALQEKTKKQMKELLQEFYEDTGVLENETKQFTIKDYCLKIGEKFKKIDNGKKLLDSDKYDLFRKGLFLNVFINYPIIGYLDPSKKIEFYKTIHKTLVSHSLDLKNKNNIIGKKIKEIMDTNKNNRGFSNFYNIMKNKFFGQKVKLYNKINHQKEDVEKTDSDDMFLAYLFLEFDWETFSRTRLEEYNNELNQGIKKRLCDSKSTNLIKKIICEKYYKKLSYDSLTKEEQLKIDLLIGMKINKDKDEIIKMRDTYYQNMKNIYANDNSCDEIANAENQGMIYKILNFFEKFTSVFAELASHLMSCICPAKSLYEKFNKDWAQYQNNKAEKEQLKKEEELNKMIELINKMDENVKEEFRKRLELAKENDIKLTQKAEKFKEDLNNFGNKLEGKNLSESEMIKQKQKFMEDELKKQFDEIKLQENEEIKNEFSIMNDEGVPLEDFPDAKKLETKVDQREIEQQFEITKDQDAYLKNPSDDNLRKYLKKEGYDDKKIEEIIQNSVFYKYNLENTNVIDSQISDPRIRNIILQGSLNEAQKIYETPQDLTDDDIISYSMRIGAARFDVATKLQSNADINIRNFAQEKLEYCQIYPAKCLAATALFVALPGAGTAAASLYLMKATLFDTTKELIDPNVEYNTKHSNFAKENPNEAKFFNSLYENSFDSLRSVLVDNEKTKNAAQNFGEKLGKDSVQYVLDKIFSKSRFRFKSLSSRKHRKLRKFKRGTTDKPDEKTILNQTSQTNHDTQATHNKQPQTSVNSKHTILKRSHTQTIKDTKQQSNLNVIPSTLKRSATHTTQTQRSDIKISKIKKIAKLIALYIYSSTKKVVNLYDSKYVDNVISQGTKKKLESIKQNVISVVNTLFGDFIKDLISNFLESFVADAYLIWFRIGREGINIINNFYQIWTDWDTKKKEFDQKEVNRTPLIGIMEVLSDVETKEERAKFDYWAPDNYSDIKERYSKIAEILISILRIFNIKSGNEKVERGTKPTLENSAFGKCFNLKNKEKKKFKFYKKYI